MDDFDPARAAAALAALGRDTPMIHTAARRIPALESWLDWLERELGATAGGAAAAARSGSPQRLGA